MFSSSKEELDELLRHLISGNLARNFEERRLLDKENPREFRVNFRLSEDAFAHLLESINLRIEHTLA